MGGGAGRTGVAAETKWSEWKGLPGSDKLLDHLETNVDWTKGTSRPGRARQQGRCGGRCRGKDARRDLFHALQQACPDRPDRFAGRCQIRWIGGASHPSPRTRSFCGRIAKMLGKGNDAVVVKTYPGPGHFGRSNGGNAGVGRGRAALARARRSGAGPVDAGRGHAVVHPFFDDVFRYPHQAGRCRKGLRAMRPNSGPPMQDDRLMGALLAGLPAIDPPSRRTLWLPGLRTVRYRLTMGLWRLSPMFRNRAGTPTGGEKLPTAVGLRDHSMRTPIQFQQNFPRELAISEAAAWPGRTHCNSGSIMSTTALKRSRRLRSESGWETRPSPHPRRAQRARPWCGDGAFRSCCVTMAIGPVPRMWR